MFANAGINGVWAPLEELAPDEWNRTIATNLTGTFLTIKYAAPYLKRQGGSVIITSSINGTRSLATPVPPRMPDRRRGRWHWQRCWRGSLPSGMCG